MQLLEGRVTKMIRKVTNTRPRRQKIGKLGKEQERGKRGKGKGKEKREKLVKKTHPVLMNGRATKKNIKY